MKRSSEDTWTIDIKDSPRGVVLVSARRGKRGKKLTGPEIPLYVVQYCEASLAPTGGSDPAFDGVLTMPFDTVEAMFLETQGNDSVSWLRQGGLPTGKRLDRFEAKIPVTMPSISEPPVLACMKTHCDGAHCGLTDWYPEIEAGIREALKGPRTSRWTTGWYASKKEIASAKITAHGDGKLLVEVSVSDDFDTPGTGEVELRLPARVERVQEAIAEAWTLAEAEQKDNRLYEGFSILKDGKWTETFIEPFGDGRILDTPPGDNYSNWGWQGESKIPLAARKKIEKWIYQWNGEPEAKVAGYTIRPWGD